MTAIQDKIPIIWKSCHWYPLPKYGEDLLWVRKRPQPKAIFSVITTKDARRQHDDDYGWKVQIDNYFTSSIYLTHNLQRSRQQMHKEICANADWLE